jgi:homocysteine S-methyltransferase
MRHREDAEKAGIDIARGIVAKIRDRVSGFQVSAPLGRVETALAVLGSQD